MTARVAEKRLRDTGHAVTTAAGASAEVDRVVADLGLPDGSGPDPVRRPRERREVLDVE